MKNLEAIGLICRLCGSAIFSRARHDFRDCSCETVYIDGGFDYCRTGIRKEPKTKGPAYIVFNIKLPKSYTAKKIYEDWNFYEDKMGLYPYNKWPKFIKDSLSAKEKKIVAKLLPKWEKHAKSTKKNKDSVSSTLLA